jgi:hypothetical protein
MRALLLIINILRKGDYEKIQKEYLSLCDHFQEYRDGK